MSRPGTYRLARVTWAVLLIEVLAWALGLALWWALATQVPQFRMDRPGVLKYLGLGPVLVLIYLADLAWRNRALLRFSDDITRGLVVPGVSSVRSAARFLLIRHGLSFVVLALAGPQFGTRVEEVKAVGVDVIVALDVSRSMQASDLKPDRMESARRAVARLTDQLRGDRMGIVVFAGEAYVQLPITSDRSAAKLFIPTLGPALVPTQGTSLGRAIDLARQSFGAENDGARAIIVITDGEDHEDDAEGAARRAQEVGIVVHAIGMGSPQGAPIPIRRGGVVQGYHKDREGNTVMTQLNEEMLRRIAAAGGGLYVRATDRSSGIEMLLEELRGMDQTETGTYRFAGHEDRYQYPLALAFLLLFAGSAIGERGRHTGDISNGSA